MGLWYVFGVFLATALTLSTTTLGSSTSVRFILIRRESQITQGALLFCTNSTVNTPWDKRCRLLGVTESQGCRRWLFLREATGSVFHLTCACLYFVFWNSQWHLCRGCRCALSCPWQPDAGMKYYLEKCCSWSLCHNNSQTRGPQRGSNNESRNMI